MSKKTYNLLFLSAHSISTLFFPVLLSSKSFSSNTPMKVLTFILFSVWMVSVIILEKGSVYWISIFSIMLFNGGLMILFLFVVSMVPKSKEKESPTFSFILVLIAFILTSSLSVKQSALENFYFQSAFLIAISSMVMVFYFLGISKLSADSFKSIKSF